MITTSHLTHEPIERHLRQTANYGYPGPLFLSPGRSIGLRMVPMARDLRFAWQEMPQQVLDVQAQKVRKSLHAALIAWAESAARRHRLYRQRALAVPAPGGTLVRGRQPVAQRHARPMLAERPALKHIMLHNIDTLGADLDPGLLGCTSPPGACLSYEVIPRRIDDRGGGLARVGGRVRLLEGLALPREEDEFRLTYYNSMTTWIAIDPLWRSSSSRGPI